MSNIKIWLDGINDQNTMRAQLVEYVTHLYKLSKSKFFSTVTKFLKVLEIAYIEHS